MEFVFIFLLNEQSKIYIFYNIHKIMKVEKSGIPRIRESISKILSKSGIRDMDALVLSELLIWDRYMDVEEISEHLNYSISGVTGSLHRLMRMHLVVRTKEGKKYLYKSESDILSVFLRLIQEIYNHDLPRLRKVVKEEFENLNNDEEKVISVLNEKLSKASQYLGELIEILEEYSKEVS